MAEVPIILKLVHSFVQQINELDWFLYGRELRHERRKLTYFFFNSRNKKAMKKFWSRL